MERKAMRCIVIAIYLLLVILHFQENDTDESNEIETAGVEIMDDEIVSAPKPEMNNIETEVITEPELETSTEVPTEPVTEFSVYNYFSTDEICFFAQVVEAEITGIGMFDAKCNVASVIFNRMAYPTMFGNNIYEILNSEQFASVADGRYLEVVVTQETFDAIEYVFINGDTTGSCLFFDSTNGNSWAANNRQWAFNDGFHDFYY